MTRRVVALLVLALAVVGVLIVVLAGGDGSEEGAPAGQATEVPGDADPEDVAVIMGWVDALREGDVEGAAGFFAIPSTAENGPTLIRIRRLEDAVAFNRSLPCGAVLTRAEAAGDFTTATFRLTERPGPGICGPGAGETAQTAFVIDDGKIVEWRRVAAGPQEPPGEVI